MKRNRIVFKTAYANDLSALVPEWWAAESLSQLNSTLVMAPLVNRNYEDTLQVAGDRVHVNKAGTFVAKNKVEGSSVTTQNLTASDTVVRLDQHKEVTFFVSEQDVRRSPQNLFEYGVRPAITALAEAIDSALLGQAGLFLGNSAGTAASAITDADMRELNKIMTANKNPTGDRKLVVGPNGEADLLGIDRYNVANLTGFDEGLQLNGLIGRAMGFEILQSQNTSDARTVGAPLVLEAIGSSAEAKGQTALSVVSWTANSTAGKWITIAGVPGVYQLVGDISSTATTANVFPALRGPAAAGAVITIVAGAGEVKAAQAQNAKHTVIDILTDGYVAADDIPLAGDYISFGDVDDGTDVYMVVSTSGTWASTATEITLSLNRPLDTDLADDDEVNIVPQDAGINFAFRRDALTLVNRPLGEVISGTGAVSREISDGTISIRITVSRNNSTGAYQVVADTLLGVQVLDLAMGAVLIG